MKKTAIVSCYFQHNYGSMLQAYATQRVLDKLGYENETINISGFHHEIRNSKIKYFIKASFTSDFLFMKKGMIKNVVLKKWSKGSYARLSQMRNQKFDEFARNSFRLSRPYGSRQELSSYCLDNYSAVLVGSDQLWLPGNIAADYYTLNFVPEAVNTIAYATSFGQAVLPRSTAKKAKKFLLKIRHIGIREESGQQLIRMLTGREVPVVCDPTLLFTGEEWMNIQQTEALIQKPYIFCYFLGSNSMHREFAKRLKEKTGCIIVALIHLDEFVKVDEQYADMTPYDISPSDFLNLIRNACYVCTDSFHCSVFSILYKRIFFAFQRYKKNAGTSTNSRLDTLFKLLGIEKRILNGDEEIRKCLDLKIDYDVVHRNLNIVRETSYRYLEMALKDEQPTDLCQKGKKHDSDTG
ncbi:MAG: polysaccharide pyruvyl transferase family protein [Lachnospiraceae bacterium]